ncbi:hypothetical protein D3C87_2072090 [compost metagenome]
MRRQPDPADRRKVMVAPDHAALALAQEVYLPMAEAGAAMLDQFTMDELEVVRRVIQAAMALQDEAAGELQERSRPRS